VPALNSKLLSPNLNYMDSQKDLTWNMRGILTDWLVWAVAVTGGEEGTLGAEGVLHDEEVKGSGKPFSIVRGKVYVIEGDEFVTQDDPKGVAKIDRNGNLLGSA